MRNLHLVTKGYASVVFESVFAVSKEYKSRKMTAEAVLESEDLMSLIVEYLNPTSIVALSRVSRDARTGLRVAIRGTPALLVQAACNAGALTKTQLMGWFALTSLETDALPRSQYVRLQGPGFYFLYRAAAFDQALDDCLGSAKEWEARLRARGSAAAAELVKMSPQKRGCEWHTPPRYHRLARCR